MSFTPISAGHPRSTVTATSIGTARLPQLATKGIEMQLRLLVDWSCQPNHHGADELLAPHSRPHGRSPHRTAEMPHLFDGIAAAPNAFPCVMVCPMVGWLNSSPRSSSDIAAARPQAQGGLVQIQAVGYIGVATQSLDDW